MKGGVIALEKLNMRQEKFCIEYAKSGNATQAYISAGYKCKDGKSCRARASKLLTLDNVQQRLREIHDETKNDSIASIQEIKEFWTKVLRNEEVEDVVGMSLDGPFKLSKDCNIKDRIKAAELLGRTAGIFVDNVNLTGNVPVTFVEDFSDKE